MNVRKHILIFLAALLGVGLAGTTGGAEPPRRIVLNQGTQRVAFYQFGTQQYRDIQTGDLSQAKPGSRLAFTGKLLRVQGDQLVLNGTAFSGMHLRLGKNVQVSAAVGSNLWVGGRRLPDEGLPVIEIEAVVVLPGDLKEFDRRWKALEGNPALTTPEDYLVLGWWLDEGKSLSSGLSTDEYNRYTESIKKSYQSALALFATRLEKGDVGLLASRLRQMQTFVANVAAGTVASRGEWQADAYRQVLHAHQKSVTDLVAGKDLPKAELNALRSSLYHLVSRQYAHYLRAEKEAREALLTAAALSSGNAAIAHDMRTAGYVMYEGEWVTKVEKKQRIEDKKSRAERTAARHSRKEEEVAERKARQAALRALREGDGTADASLRVNLLLGLRTEESVGELGNQLSTLPEDTARQALWLSFSQLGSAASMRLLVKANQSKFPSVRMDAADLLLATGRVSAAKRIVEMLEKEKDASVARHLVLGLQRLPGKAGIQGLVDAANAKIAVPKAKVLVFQLLGLETAQPLGNDAFGWKAWWNQNQATFKRQPLPQ